MFANAVDWVVNEVSDGSATCRAGIRSGECGTHTSRTLMLAELTDVLAVVPAASNRDAYARAIVDDNVLGKATIATRRSTNQRLGELYGLDPAVPLFRVLRRLWAMDAVGRPLLALLCGLARDPLLRATAPAVLNLPIGAELARATVLDALREAVGARLNEASLDKVARNTASSWEQSGHLEGRVRKLRRRVTPTPGSLAFAMWLGAVEGLANEPLLRCRWVNVLDRTADELLPTVLDAKRLGLLHARVGGGVVEIDARRLDPLDRRIAG